MSQRNPLILLAMLFATTVTGVALAADPATPADKRVRLDANGDGVIDRQEAAASPRLAARFDELDKNKDGKLSGDELPQWRHGSRGHGGGSEGRHGSRHGGGRGGLLAAMDTDKDGRVSAAEYRAYFDKLDVNKDGYIDRADREARAKQRYDAWFAAADTDKDGKLSKAELEAARAKMGARGGHAEGGWHGPRGSRSAAPASSPAPAVQK